MVGNSKIWSLQLPNSQANRNQNWHRWLYQRCLSVCKILSRSDQGFCSHACPFHAPDCLLGCFLVLNVTHSWGAHVDFDAKNMSKDAILCNSVPLQDQKTKPTFRPFFPRTTTTFRPSLNKTLKNFVWKLLSKTCSPVIGHLLSESHKIFIVNRQIEVWF